MSRRFGSLHGLRETDALAQRYGVRPSALLSEHDPYRAYCVDLACALAGELSVPKVAPPKVAPPPPPVRRRFDGHAPLLVGTISRAED